MNVTRTTCAALAALTLTSCGSAAAKPAASPEKPRLYVAADACAVKGARDYGRSISVNNGGEKYGMGHTLADIQCLLGKLGMPADVAAHIGQTRALDGMQTDTWDGIAARWTYHPDKGLNITLVDERHSASSR